jgi:MSHA pilin protein MshC
MTIVNKKSTAGFSLFEFIIVIVLLSILSVFALGSLFDQDEFAARGFFDDTVNAVRFAQKLAISTGCDVQVAITISGYQLLQRATTCTTGGFVNTVKNPADRAKNYANLNIPNGFNLSPTTTVTFNALGIPGSDEIFTLTNGTTTYSFNLSGQTGLVW